MILGLFLAGIAFWVLLSQPKPPPAELVFNKPKISINMDVFDSEEFKNLQPFTELRMQFQYKANTTEGEQVSGFVQAVSAKEAREILAEAGMVVLELEESGIGRENPFTPY